MKHEKVKYNAAFALVNDITFAKNLFTLLMAWFNQCYESDKIKAEKIWLL